MPPCACGSEQAVQANREGLDAHRLRRLDEASAAYQRALRLAPPRDPSTQEKALILRFAPRVLVTPRDPFPLRDAAAVMHPTAPWIAYHFFWEDDIDFPDDNDPCDHELMWVRLDESRQQILDYYTYFHARILKAPPEALAEAQGRGQPSVVVQWGKHGTMPLHWQRLAIVADAGDVERGYLKLDRSITLENYNRSTFQKLSEFGRQSQESPLARGWPLKFTGSWSDFIDFSKLVDPRALLETRGMMKVSCWNNAIIDRHFIPYNFAAKTEWPADICVSRR